MNIAQQDDGKCGAFYIDEDGEIIAEMTYQWNDSESFIINHTEVDDKLKGKGVGQMLVDRAVDFAREKNIKISATCTFAHKVLERDEKYRDVFTTL